MLHTWPRCHVRVVRWGIGIIPHLCRALQSLLAFFLAACGRGTAFSPVLASRLSCHRAPAAPRPPTRPPPCTDQPLDRTREQVPHLRLREHGRPGVLRHQQRGPAGGGDGRNRSWRRAQRGGGHRGYSTWGRAQVGRPARPRGGDRARDHIAHAGSYGELRQTVVS